MSSLVALVAMLVVTSALADDDYNSLNFTQIAGRNGYLTDEHSVVTEDGYILTIFRVSSGNCTEPKGRPVLLMHGFLESSDCYLDAGLGVAYPYLLADDCFDTWIGNNRGNHYGRAHVSLNPDTDNEFWAYSVDEMGLYDMPAHIDYILNITGSKTINYIGFSQGGGEIMITCSEKPEYNDKINLIFGMSPATRVQHSSSPLFTLLLEGFYSLKDFLSHPGIDELFQKGAAAQSLLDFICGEQSIIRLLGITYDEVCVGFINLIDPYHRTDAFSSDTLARIYAHFPEGVSVQLFSQYAQGLSSDFYQKYDYGSEAKNMAKYNSKTPPIYNVTKVTVPVVLTYGEMDTLVSRIDVEWLKNQLPNVLELKKVDDPSWVHLDNIYNSNITTLMYPTIREYLSSYEKCALSK